MDGAFQHTLKSGSAPAYFSPVLKALWIAAKGDLEAALTILRPLNGTDVAWVRAHVHRARGEIEAAQQCYSRARKTMPRISVDRESNLIGNILLATPDFAVLV